MGGNTPSINANGQDGKSDGAGLWSASLELRDVIHAVFADGGAPQSVRQIFYQCTVRGAVPKSESGYRRVAYQLKQMRLDGSIPYGWISDSSRRRIKDTTHWSMTSALERFQQTYRKDLWAQQDVHLEVWCEKEALTGVLWPVCHTWDVPLYPAKGYASMTFLFEAAQQIKATGKHGIVLHVGDFDPSGVDAAHKIRDGLREHGADITFRRLAVTEEQIARYNLPTRPTKRSDPRAKGWDKPSVELDAMPARVLRNLVEDAIVDHIDADEWQRMQRIEQLEKQTLEQMIANWKQS